MQTEMKGMRNERNEDKQSNMNFHRLYSNHNSQLSILNSQLSILNSQLISATTVLPSITPKFLILRASVSSATYFSHVFMSLQVVASFKVIIIVNSPFSMKAQRTFLPISTRNSAL